MRNVIIVLVATIFVASNSAHGQITSSEKSFTLSGVRATALNEVNLRSGASISAPVIERIPANTCLQVTEDRGAWLKVRVCTSRLEAFVYRPLVSTAADVVVDRLLSQDPTLRRTRLEPVTPRTIPTGASSHTRRVAEIWNKYGGLLERLAVHLAIEPEAAIAVIAAESDGIAFVANRPVIRFENHVFWDIWGRHNPSTFERHFRFRRDQRRHEDHTFRTAVDQPWKTVHGEGQTREWMVLEMAVRLDRPDAYRSTSWGLPQIMGFNHSRIGYSSVESMVASFSDPQTGINMQILGFFDFIRGGLRNSPTVVALRRQDWMSFAQLYNGFGKEDQYTKPLSTYYGAAEKLLG